MFNGGSSLRSTGCERVGRAAEHVQPNAYLSGIILRTPKSDDSLASCPIPALPFFPSLSGVSLLCLFLAKPLSFRIRNSIKYDSFFLCSFPAIPRPADGVRKAGLTGDSYSQSHSEPPVHSHPASASPGTCPVRSVCTRDSGSARSVRHTGCLRSLPASSARRWPRPAP